MKNGQTKTVEKTVPKQNGQTETVEKTVTTTQDISNDGLPAGYRPPIPKKPDLFVGKYVRVWWTLDDRAYGGTIKRISRGKVDILYDDGTRKTYTQSRIETRISLGEVYIYAYMHAWRNIHG